jgi:hypothetical protein
MTTETLSTIETLLESLLEETDDSEVHYKLRTALQLLEIQKSDIRQLEDAAADDEQLERRLRKLGYIE